MAQWCTADQSLKNTGSCCPLEDIEEFKFTPCSTVSIPPDVGLVLKSARKWDEVHFISDY